MQLENFIIDFVNIIFLIVLAVNFSISFLLYFGSNKKTENIIVFILFMSLAFWVLGAFFFYNFEIIDKWILLLLYISSSIFASVFLLFSLIFSNYKYSKIYFSIFIPNFAIIWLLFTGNILKGVVYNNNEKIIIFDNFYFIFAFYIITYFSIGLIILYLKLRKKTITKKEKIITFYLLIGITLSSTFGIITNLIMPWFGNFSLFFVGPIQSILFSGLIAYLVTKHSFLNIKVIAVELFTFLIWIFIIVKIFLSDSYEERITEIGLLIFVVFFGILIIRSVLREVRIREKIENLAKELERANKKLRSLDNEKTEFMSFASHQLRTPLTSIKGFVSMLYDGDYGKLNKEQKEVTELVFNSTENMNNLVDDLLNASRIERKKGFDYNFVIDSPIDLIKGLIDNLKIQAYKNKIKFIFENKIDKYIKIKFDSRILLQAISNLIQNAIKYTEKQGEVYVKLSRTNNHLEILIKDTGIGMSKEDLKMIFRRFYRNKNVKENYPEGTGLGLYIAERIIKDHNGEIWAESKGIGNGSEFYITLPIVKD